MRFSASRYRRRGIALVAGATLTAGLTMAATAVVTASTSASASTERSGQSLGTEARLLAAAAVQNLSVLPAGRPGARASVPWRMVGAGWTLAEYTAGNLAHPRPVTLYLVDPAGGRYRLYQWAATKSPWQLIDWSGDKTRALFALQGTGGPVRMRQLTLATGRVSAFTLPSAATLLGYTRPDGRSILVSDRGIDRYSLTGVRQAGLIGGSMFSTALSAPNGATEIVNGGTGVELVRNTGGVIRTLTVPGTSARVGGCLPARWWSAADVLVSCLTTTATAAPRVWLVPVNGAPPTALTPLRSGRGPDLGDLDVWKLRSGTYVQALGGCGTRFIGKQLSGGRVSVVNVPGSSGNNVVVATSGQRMLVREFTECMPGSSLVWFAPSTGAVTHVLTAPANGYGVIGVAAYDRNGQQPGLLP